MTEWAPRTARRLSDEELSKRLLLCIDRPRFFHKGEKEAYIREAARRIKTKRVFIGGSA